MAGHKIHKRRMIGVVTSDKMNKTRVVLVERRVADRKYGKYLTSRTKYKAHDEKNEFKSGDRVQIGSQEMVLVAGANEAVRTATRNPLKMTLPKIPESQPAPSVSTKPPYPSEPDAEASMVRRADALWVTASTMTRLNGPPVNAGSDQLSVMRVLAQHASSSEVIIDLRRPTLSE